MKVNTEPIPATETAAATAEGPVGENKGYKQISQMKSRNKSEFRYHKLHLELDVQVYMEMTDDMLTRSRVGLPHVLLQLVVVLFRRHLAVHEVLDSSRFLHDVPDLM